MGWFDPKPEAIRDVVLEALRSLPRPPPGEKVKELEYRDAVAQIFTAMGATGVKREADVGRTGTNLDVYANVNGHDFIVTIKRGCSEQKVKTVIGEISIVRQHWVPKNAGKRTFAIFLICGYAKDQELEALGSFDPFRKAQSNSDFEICEACIPNGKWEKA
ncbi:MAG: hypothetical protein ACHREM_10750 [Polyangiales bacterium]